MSNRLGVGFIGSGFNTRFHILGWRGVRDADVRGVWSPNAKHAASAAKLARDIGVGDARAHRSITEMVADHAIDAIWLCGPNHTRIENVEEIVAAVKSGKGTLKEFEEDPGPEVDAIEAYCMAFRRADAQAVQGFDPKFRFYRIADIDFSFRLRDKGGRAMVVPGLPLERYEHRLWEATTSTERDRLSRRNFYRFLDRWGKREDLLVGGSRQ